MSAEIFQIDEIRRDHELHRQWRRDAMAQAIHENPILRPRDRERVALALGRMMVEASLKHGEKTKLVAETWGPNCPLKKLDIVTLPKEYGDSRTSRLAAKPKRYAQLAKQIAAMTNRDHRDLWLDVFSGTRLEQIAMRRADRFIDDQPDDWEKLVELIEAMTARVSEDLHLRDHLQAIASRLGTYNLESESIRLGGSRLLPHGPLDGGYEVWEEFPPIPSTPLVATDLKNPFERTLKLNRGGLVELVPVTVTVSREVRLAIGPATDEHTPQPLFEIRTIVDLIDANGWNWANRRRWFYLLDAETFATYDKNGNEVVGEVDLGPEPGVSGRWIPLVEEGPIDSSQTRTGPVNEQRLFAQHDVGCAQFEHVYAAWRRVDAFSCQDFLGVRIAPDNSKRSATLLPNNIAASVVEADLVDRDHGSIERDLRGDAERITGLVREYIVQLRSEASVRHREVLDQWSDKGGSNDE